MEDKEVEYFFASDASAVIEHTNRVIYLEVRILIYGEVARGKTYSNFAGR